MAAESLAKRLSATKLDQLSERELRAVLAALVNGVQAIAAKLDADGTVTDTDYAATFATHITD